MKTNHKLWRLPLEVSSEAMTSRERFWYSRPRLRRWLKHNCWFLVYGIHAIFAAIVFTWLMLRDEFILAFLALTIQMLVYLATSYIIVNLLRTLFEVGDFRFCPKCEAAVRPHFSSPLLGWRRRVSCPNKDCGHIFHSSSAKLAADP